MSARDGTSVHAQSVFGTQGAGFDGVSPWIQIYGGLSYTFGDEDAQLGATNAAYQVSLAYWFPERRPATMQDDGIQQEEGRTFEVVTITPEGGRPFSFSGGSATHLIDRVVEQEAEKVSVTGTPTIARSRASSSPSPYDAVGSIATTGM